MRLAAVNYWLLLTAVAGAAQPKAVIDQAVNGVITASGGVVVVTTNGTIADRKVLRLNGTVLPTDAIVAFGQPPAGTQVELLAISNNAAGPPLYDLATATFGAGPGPVPPPPIPPGPTPLPDGRFKLAQAAFNAMSSQPANIRALAPAFATNFEGTAAAATAGTLTTPAAMLTDTFQKNQAAEGALAPACQPLSVALAAALSALKLAPTDLASHITAWHELALGFKAVQP